jgi:hypothetical protein
MSDRTLAGLPDLSPKYATGPAFRSMLVAITLALGVLAIGIGAMLHQAKGRVPAAESARRTAIAGGLVTTTQPDTLGE